MPPCPHLHLEHSASPSTATIQTTTPYSNISTPSQIWQLATLVPGSSAAKQQATHRKLQREVLQLRAQLRSTSSQDEFAKWAKLKRKEDKLLADFEKSSTSHCSNKSKEKTSKKNEGELTIFFFFSLSLHRQGSCCS
jgi:hypothetical protein